MATPAVGSSLQAQGTPTGHPLTVQPWRFIPAGAGNTRPEYCRYTLIAVHPCRRREHLVCVILYTASLGSSLQAQGTHHLVIEFRYLIRFIPAGAGNTENTLIKSNLPAVHPCRRREHRPARLEQPIETGSSLQAQGTRINGRGEKNISRFIPAGAGNTTVVNAIDGLRAVHPCRRREHNEKLNKNNDISGSSLQAQGTQKGRSQERHHKRFIPAGAGNTPQSASIPFL